MPTTTSWSRARPTRVWRRWSSPPESRPRPTCWPATGAEPRPRSRSRSSSPFSARRSRHRVRRSPAPTTFRRATGRDRRRSGRARRGPGPDREVVSAAPHVPRLTTAEVVGRRLVRHHLTAPIEPEQIDELAGELCGIHAQVMGCAEISAGIRLRDGTRQVLREALWERRSLIKTYGLRGTIYIFLAK